MLCCAVPVCVVLQCVAAGAKHCEQPVCCTHIVCSIAVSCIGTLLSGIHFWYMSWLLCTKFGTVAAAVEEAIIALVRLYQNYTFKLSEKLLTSPLEVKQGITMSPKGGLPVTVIKRHSSKAPTVAAST